MTSKRVEDLVRDNLAANVERIIRRDFDGNQTEAQEKIGITQGHLSQILKGSKGDRGIGLSALLRLREYTKWSIDELLGLEPIGQERVISEQLAELQKNVAKLMDARPPSRPRARRPPG